MTLDIKQLKELVKLQKSKKHGCKEGDEKVTFILHNDVVDKIKAIAVLADMKIKDVALEALELYITEYEKAGTVEHRIATLATDEAKAKIQAERTKGMITIDPDLYATVTEAAELLRKTPITVRAYIKKGKLDYIKKGNLTYYITRASIDTFLKN
jgi:excisionase family DNA binding protein